MDVTEPKAAGRDRLRELLARQALRLLGREADHGDPIDWHRRRTGGER